MQVSWFPQASGSDCVVRGVTSTFSSRTFAAVVMTTSLAARQSSRINLQQREIIHSMHQLWSLNSSVRPYLSCIGITGPAVVTSIVCHAVFTLHNAVTCTKPLVWLLVLVSGSGLCTQKGGQSTYCKNVGCVKTSPNRRRAVAETVCSAVAAAAAAVVVRMMEAGLLCVSDLLTSWRTHNHFFFSLQFVSHGSNRCGYATLCRRAMCGRDT